MGKLIAHHRGSLFMSVGGLAVLLAALAVRLSCHSEQPRLSKNAVLEVEALARDEAPRAEAAIDTITRDVENIPNDTPETVRAEVTGALTSLGIKIDQTMALEGEARAGIQAKLLEEMDRTVPTLRKNLRVLLARIGEKGDWDAQFPDLKPFWQGRIPTRQHGPGGIPFAPRSMCGFLRVLPPPSLVMIDSLDTELGEVAGRSAREIAELKRDVLREFAESGDDESKGNERELRKFADQVLRDLASIEGQILGELGELSKRFNLTLSQVLTAFAVKAGGTSGGADLGAIETALQGKLAGDTNTNTRAALTNAERGTGQVGSLLGGQVADLALRKLEKIIALARDLTNDLQNLIQDANDRLDRIDRERSKGRPDSKVEKALGRVADGIVADVNAIESEIQKGEIKIAGGVASSLLPAVQNEFVNQTKLLAPRVETVLSALIDRLRGELGQVTNPAVQGKITNAILALRGLDKSFDTISIALAFTAPAPNTITSTIPAIQFTMTDSGSGPNPASRQLLAINAGPIAPGTTDLTSSTTVVLDDQVNGIVTVAATGLPASALQDGFITLQASGTDFANNPRTVATNLFVLDRQPPLITVNSPASGSALSSMTVPLNVTITDAVSGIAVGSIRVTFNGTDITSTTTQTLGTLNALGSPNIVQLSTTLNAQGGSNTVSISASDLAGNVSAVSSSFAVSTSTILQSEVNAAFANNSPQLQQTLGIEIVSGDAQNGTTGMLAANPLTVHVFDQSTMASVPDVQVHFNITAGGGMILNGLSLQTHTDSSGRASVSYVIGLLPGVNTITAALANSAPDSSDDFSTDASVNFTITGMPAALTNATVQGPCNYLFSTSDFPGSALSVLLRVQLADSNGSPMNGQAVVPRIDSFEGVSPPIPSVGYFVPRYRLTDPQGMATFAFVIDQNLRPTPGVIDPITKLSISGQFIMTFIAPQFFGGDGNPLSFSIPGTVLDPNATPRDPIIEYATPNNSGQGQVGLASQQTGLGLRAFSSGRGGTIIYEIIEGTGTFGDLTEGSNKRPFVTCSPSNIVINVDSAGHTGVKFQKNNDNDVVLVHIGAGSDVFAIGPPEVILAGATNPTQEFTFVEPSTNPGSDPGKAYLVESVLPATLCAPPPCEGVEFGRSMRRNGHDGRKNPGTHPTPAAIRDLAA